MPRDALSCRSGQPWPGLAMKLRGRKNETFKNYGALLFLQISFYKRSAPDNVVGCCAQTVRLGGWHQGGHLGGSRLAVHAMPLLRFWAGKGSTAAPML